jgi:hypothetical protein
MDRSCAHGLGWRPDVRTTGYPKVDFEPPAKSHFEQVHRVSFDHESNLAKIPFSKMFAARHSIYSMKPGLNPGLKVTYLYHDGDITEVRIVVPACVMHC